MSRSSEYSKKHYRLIAGYRVRISGRFYLGEGQETSLIVTPNDFLVSKNRVQPYLIYGSDFQVHVPRSLCDKATITIRKDTGEVIAKSRSYTRNQQANKAATKKNKFLHANRS